VGQNWKKPVNLGGPVNSGHWESQPSFSADGSTLYFVRGVKDGDNRVNTGDIYVSHLTEGGYWDTPKKLGPNINTPGDEASVQIHPDGKTLYFSSDGHVGMGGLDIYMSKMNDSGDWGKAMNLGYPINTWGEENSLLVSADGQIAYFASDREGGFGELDLYSFDMPESLQPEPVTYMKGTVYDIDTKKKLEAVFELIDLETNKVAVKSYSNPLSGEFLVSLPVNREYALNVSREGYNFFSENFELKAGSISEPFLKDVPLVPLKVVGPEDGGIVLKNVFFDTDKFDLKPKSKVELNKLADFLKANPELVIELGGHTDNKGSKTHNKTLSQDRAKAVLDFLVTAGVEAKRLSSNGYGDERPIADNETEEGRAMNRRTEYKITGRIPVPER
jgi:outer membrane protein OmpA-like peptidoglycan-associated protein